MPTVPPMPDLPGIDAPDPAHLPIGPPEDEEDPSSAGFSSFLDNNVANSNIIPDYAANE